MSKGDKRTKLKLCPCMYCAYLRTLSNSKRKAFERRQEVLKALGYQYIVDKAGLVSIQPYSKMYSFKVSGL